MLSGPARQEDNKKHHHTIMGPFSNDKTLCYSKDESLEVTVILGQRRHSGFLSFIVDIVTCNV